MTADERRSFVREELRFKVKYKVLTKKEYGDLQRFDHVAFPADMTADPEKFSAWNNGAPSAADASLINYLLQMDEKLDQILRLLTENQKEKAATSPFAEGIGQNISGSGMKLTVDSPVASGAIIHAKFFLCKYPMIFMEVFGQVIRVLPVEKDRRTFYQLGVEFIELNEHDRERIINYVFQKQRAMIRKKKSER